MPRKTRKPVEPTRAQAAAAGESPIDINLAAATLDQVFQARDEGQVTLETTRDIYQFLRTYAQQLDAREQRLFTAIELLSAQLSNHIDTVARRHERMTKLIERNTRSREDAEWEITNLHSVLATWHQHHVVMQAALVHALQALHLERDIQRLPAVPELPPRRPRELELEQGARNPALPG